MDPRTQQGKLVPYPTPYGTHGPPILTKRIPKTKKYMYLTLNGIQD